MSHPDPTRTYEEDAAAEAGRKTKKRRTTAVIKAEPQAVASPAGSIEGLIGQAINKGVPVETMERLLEMKRRWDADRAKEAFDKAMSGFQGECPVIVKSKPGGKTKSGQVAYMYAPLDVIIDQVRPLLQKHGFSYMIKTKMVSGLVTVTCTVKHQQGHSEDSSVEMPLGDRTSIMSAPQAVAATITFAKRYAFCNAFGIMTGDEDNDAAPDSYVPRGTNNNPPASPSKPTKVVANGEPFDDGRISKPQVAKLFTLLKPLGIKDKEQARTFCAAALKQEPGSFRITSMSKKDASYMIDKLENQPVEGKVAPAKNSDVTDEDIAEIDKSKK